MEKMFGDKGSIIEDFSETVNLEICGYSLELSEINFGMLKNNICSTYNSNNFLKSLRNYRMLESL